MNRQKLYALVQPQKYEAIVVLSMQEEDLSTMHTIGTAAVVVQITGTNWPRPAYTLLVTGICRFRLETLLQENPYPVAIVTQLDKLPGEESGW